MIKNIAQVTCFFLFSFIIQCAKAQKTLIYHDGIHNTTAKYALTFLQKNSPADNDVTRITLEWDFPESALFTFNLVTTRPCDEDLETTQPVLAYASKLEGGKYLCKVFTHEKQGRLKLPAGSDLIEPASYIENDSGLWGGAWKVVISRESELPMLTRGSKLYSGNATYPLSGNQALHDNTFQLSGGGGGGQWPPMPPWKGFYPGGEFISLATLFKFSGSDQTILVHLSFQEEEYFSSITVAAWLQLEAEGRANFSGLLRFFNERQQAVIDSSVIDSSVIDSSVLVAELLRWHDQYVGGEEEVRGEQLSFNPPERIDISCYTNSGVVYFGKKKRQSSMAFSAPSASSKKSQSDKPEQVEKNEESANNNYSDGVGAPPPPDQNQGAVGVTEAVAELDLFKIVPASGLQMAVISPAFISALYGLGVLGWRHSLTLSAEATSPDYTNDSGRLLIQVLVLSGITDFDQKLNFLRLLYIYTVLRYPDKLEDLKRHIPTKYFESISKPVSLSHLESEADSSILSRLIVLSALDPESTESLLSRLPYLRKATNNSVQMVFLEGAKSRRGQREGWDYFYTLFENEEGVFKRFFSGLDFVREKVKPSESADGKASQSSSSDILSVLVARFSPLSTEFRLATHRLDKSDKPYGGYVTYDENLLFMALLTKKMKRTDKINIYQERSINRYLNTLLLLADGGLPEEITTLTEVAEVLGVDLVQNKDDPFCLSFKEKDVGRGVAMSLPLLKWLAGALDIYQTFNQEAVQDIVQILRALKLDVVEIGAGHGMLSKALKAAGQPVVRVTDKAPPVYPFFSDLVVSQTAQEVMSEFGEKTIFIAASPNEGMMLKVAAGSEKQIVLLIGSLLGARLEEEENVRVLPLALTNFSPRMKGQQSELVFVNFDQDEQDEIVKKIPQQYIIRSLKKK